MPYKVKRTYGTLGKTFRDVFGTFGSFVMDDPSWSSSFGPPNDPPGGGSSTMEGVKPPYYSRPGKKRRCGPERRTGVQSKKGRTRSKSKTKSGNKRSQSYGGSSGLWYVAKKRGVKRLRVQNKYGKKKKVKFL